MEGGVRAQRRGWLHACRPGRRFARGIGRRAPPALRGHDACARAPGHPGAAALLCHAADAQWRPAH
ncbi:hypothetical protein FD64_15025, partial [Staphylococcus aureus]